MNRTSAAYRKKFESLFENLGQTQRELAIELMFERARSFSVQQDVPLDQALYKVYVDATHLKSRPRLFVTPPVFTCDAGLGGLARWLRASGYEAHWNPNIDDSELIEEAQRLPAFLLTTDSLLMERGVLRDGMIPSLWIPPTLKKFDQLLYVVRELNLSLRAARCMLCSGELTSVPKEKVRSQIPPKTYAWLNEYYECRRCGKLYWHGTHWIDIQKRLLTSS